MLQRFYKPQRQGAGCLKLHKKHIFFKYRGAKLPQESFSSVLRYRSAVSKVTRSPGSLGQNSARRLQPINILGNSVYREDSSLFRAVFAFARGHPYRACALQTLLRPAQGKRGAAFVYDAAIFLFQLGVYRGVGIGHAVAAQAQLSFVFRLIKGNAV